MFRPNDIQTRLRQQPFRPFRLIVSEGQVFDISHPKLVVVGLRDVHIYFPSEELPPFPDRVARIALVDIVSVEDLPPGTPAADSPPP